MYEKFFLYLYNKNKQKKNIMKTAGKTLVKKEVKKVGSHMGTIKKALELSGFDSSDYIEYINECISKKYNNVGPQIKKSIRYQ